eukprot:TRINITY_DN387_c0_g3_i3.p1 TRINITY_DN387_c0_g3~~TRINITY_DN387_c0_g3_i3.p1  ORF type:complete len:754 (-),score=117.63 TRINITY_DN387_c0_g3_i3:61-2322(-)
MCIRDRVSTQSTWVQKYIQQTKFVQNLNYLVGSKVFNKGKIKFDKIKFMLIFFIWFFYQSILCDILRPKDNFTNINYEEDMGICIGVSGNNSNLTEYEKFEAFKQHNCLPVIVLEGIQATKLQLLITDCDALTDDILDNCNIMTEKNKHRFVWIQPPGLIKCKSNISEFLVWVSFVDDPVSLLGGGKCLNALFGEQLNYLNAFYKKDPPYIIPDQPGISITWLGSTSDTMKSSKCGVTASEDMGQTPLPISDFMDFQQFYDYTIGMGYQPGLTLLPIPYDWRRLAGSNEVVTTFQRTIEYAYSITGKKVVVTAHSYGCVNFLALMESIPQSFKDKYIDSFLGLACAWTGATYIIDLTIAGLNLGWWDFGYPFSDLRNLITGLTSIYDLIPKDIFNSSTQWGQEISQRAEQEKNWDPANNNISFSWFPSPSNQCYSLRDNDTSCGFHLYNFFKYPLAYAQNNTSYMLNNTAITQLLEQYMVRTMEEIDFQKQVNEGKVSAEEQEEVWGTKKLIPKDRIQLMMEMIERNGVQQLINPGVQIHHIFGGNYQTQTWYNITGNPREQTDKGKTADKDVMQVFTHWGDFRVNIDNGIVPSLKWAWEFDNHVQNAKPIHMIDYCSNYSQIMHKDQTGKYTTQFKNITQNTYNGIMCLNKKHPEFPDDEFIDKYAAILIQSGQPGTSEINLTENDVNMIIQTCPHIMAPWKFQTAEELYQYGINQENLQEYKTNFSFPFAQPSSEFIEFLEQFYTSLASQQ